MHILKSALAFSLLALCSAGAAQSGGQIEFRDNSEGIDKPVSDIAPMIPVTFVTPDKKFDVVSYRTGASERLKFSAARFEVDGEKFEMLLSDNMLVVSTQPWHPVRDGLSAARAFVPRLMRCHTLKPDNLGCTIHSGRAQAATLEARYLAGRDVWTVGINPKSFVEAQGIELGTDTQLTISDGNFKISRDYSLQPSFLFPTRPNVKISGGDGDRVLKALSEGRDVTVSFPDKDGKRHEYPISSRDARIGFLVFQNVWPAMIAAHKD